MSLAEQKEFFYATIAPSQPNQWEVDELFDALDHFDSEIRWALLNQVDAIWPVSHSLCLAFLSEGAQCLEQIPQELITDWVRQLLDIYESGGLQACRMFMADVETCFMSPRRGEAGALLTEISPRMIHYLRGISGRTIELGSAEVAYTDTNKIYLPAKIGVFTSKRDNEILYKLIITLQWAHIRSRLFSEMADQALTLKGNEGQKEYSPFSAYADKDMALELLCILQFVKSYFYIEKELVGLARSARPLVKKLLSKWALQRPEGKEGALLAFFANHFHTKRQDEDSQTGLREQSVLNISKKQLVEERVLDLLPNFYKQVATLPGGYPLEPIKHLLGTFSFETAVRIVIQQREKEKQLFIIGLSDFLGQIEKGSSKQENQKIDSALFADEFALNLTKQIQDTHQFANIEIAIDNSKAELPADLQLLMADIIEDLGFLPESYVQAAVGQKGRGFNKGESRAGDDSQQLIYMPSRCEYVYDEWDYRRGGYRKNWTVLYEKTISPVRSTFVAETLAKYRVQISKIQRQFEMLRTKERYARRRLNGDEIDLDAHVEAVGDNYAGLVPSDRLYIRLLRDDRDLSSLFLVDMSNSTEGWVGDCIKETLVLLTEGLEIVGDPYGIYGFSGMRRSKVEFYEIKNIEQQYDTEIQNRIAAIKPLEYTRMGSPIRHGCRKLLETQSKFKLLIVVSDGKPEDYDDYKGKYAIEDTRKALLEAKGSGIHPFCITIDKKAADYLPHMFGMNNYMVVDNIYALPTRMIEMYRMLTS